MFGLGKKERAAEEAERHIRVLFAGLGALEGKAVPNQCFADPYVSAFLQVLTLHATTLIFRDRMPDQVTMTGIMAAALDKIVPGYGLGIVRGVVSVADPSHPLHLNYSVGRREGNAYVVSILREDYSASQDLILSFRQFVSRNYL